MSIFLPHRVLIVKTENKLCVIWLPVCFFLLGTLFPAFEIEAFRPVERKDFPRYPNGEISAVIHPNLQVSRRLKKERREGLCLCGYV